MVSIFNERGTVLAGAYVTERIMPGVIYIDHGAKWDPIVPGEIDRGGAINTIVPRSTTSKNAVGHAVSGFLADVREDRHGSAEGQVSGSVREAVPPLRWSRLGSLHLGEGVMGKVLVIDLNICNGCYNCQVACKDEHVANDWSPIAKPQPDTGQFWNKVNDLERGQVPKVKVTYLHSICQHCDDAPCIPACNVDAIYQRDDGAVIIDPDKCRGNQLCLEACPYEDVIYFNDSLNIAQKCTFCAHLLDDGWTEPRCADACPTGAFTFGDEDDPEIKELVAKAEPLKPRAGRQAARVLHRPAQAVHRRRGVRQRGRRVHRGRHGHRDQRRQPGHAAEAVTDSYGDFWLKDLEPGEYTLLVEKYGYLPQKIGPVDATADINVGDIALWKAEFIDA